MDDQLRVLVHPTEPEQHGPTTPSQVHVGSAGSCCTCMLALFLTLWCACTATITERYSPLQSQLQAALLLTVQHVACLMCLFIPVESVPISVSLR